MRFGPPRGPDPGIPPQRAVRRGGGSGKGGRHGAEWSCVRTQPLHGGRRHGDGPQYAVFLERRRPPAGSGAAGVRARQPAGRRGGRGVAGEARSGSGRVPGGGDVACAGGGGGVRSRVGGVAAAGVAPQPGAARAVRLRPAGLAEAAEAFSGALGDGGDGGVGTGERAPRRGAHRVGVLALSGQRDADRGGDGRGVRHGVGAAPAADGGTAGVRPAPGLRRQGGREPLDGSEEREDGEDVEPGRRLGEARDERRGREDGQGVEQGEDVVRLRAAPDRGRRTRDPGVVRGDGGVALGAQGAVGGTGPVVRGRAGAGGALCGLLRRPGAGRRAAEEEAVGRPRGAAAGRRPGAVAGGEGGAGVRPVEADPAVATRGWRRQRAAQREGRGVLPLPGDGGGAADGVPRLRAGARHAEVPLPGGRPRPRLQGAGGVLPRRRREGRGLRARRAHRLGGPRPAHLHADAVGKSVVVAGLQPARRPGADPSTRRRSRSASTSASPSSAPAAAARRNSPSCCPACWRRPAAA